MKGLVSKTIQGELTAALGSTAHSLTQIKGHIPISSRATFHAKTNPGLVVLLTL
jgi:hypothetical protein